jgi:hypothetical protein
LGGFDGKPDPLQPIAMNDPWRMERHRQKDPDSSGNRPAAFNCIGCNGRLRRRHIKTGVRSHDVPAIAKNEMSSKEWRQNWARLIQKIYEVDPLICPKCQGEMRIIAFILAGTICCADFTLTTYRHPGINFSKKASSYRDGIEGLERIHNPVIGYIDIGEDIGVASKVLSIDN